MQNLPIDVHIVSDGEEAIRFISLADSDEDAPCPSIVMVDLNLPKRDGFEVMQAIRGSRRCREVAVLVVTSSDAPSDREGAASLGARYFRKPPSYEEFMKIGSVLKGILEEKK